MNYLRYVCLAGLLSGLHSTSLFADENWGLCRIPAYYVVEKEKHDSIATEVESNYLIRDENSFLTFSGEVELKRGDQTIQADRIVFDEDSEQLEASGTVIFEKPDFRLTSEQLNFDQKTKSGVIENPAFEMPNRHGRGTADKAEILDENRSRFSDLLYTSCDPGDRDWHFTSDELEIDDESGLGTAKHATIYFQDIPFFYLPYFQFPIDDRRMSGVLTPTFNISDSDNSHLAVPVYWNIAPNFDTTFTPAQYPNRGLLYNSEHRYLFRHQRGQIDYSRIDDDITNETRWFKKWQHNASYSDYSLTGNLLLQEVSDDDFLGDFDRLVPGNDEIDHLDRHLQFTITGNSWRSSMLWQNHQTVDSNIAIASRPYQRLPQLTVISQFQRADNGLQFSIQNELVHFKREQSINGDRAHIVPGISWLSSDSWYFFEPELQYLFTEYSLENNTLGDNSIHRSLPIASIDSGLIFERIMGPDDNWLQTLEPRLYFVHIPFEDQNEIPDFDTSLSSESYANFFKANRFVGADRIGDTDQVTFGLGTRVYNDKGDELLYARIAQIYYADDRLVSLSNTIDERDRSNIITAIDIRPTTNLKIGSELIYDEELEEFTEKNLSLNWAKNGFALNLEYFFDDETLEQELLSFVYPINQRWSIFGKYHQSLLFEKPVENLFGLSYESCCWGLKILASQISDDDFIETDQALYFELTLKGLTQTGQNVDGYLQGKIPGYQSQF